jgi:proteic killer suppression protein
MILSFGNRITEELWTTGRTRRLPANLLRRTYAKLLAVDSATDIEHLRYPPSNHLEKLSGDRKGQHSICINDQYRICFVWRDGNAYNVEVVDYH